jgi:hypothetical protein
MSTNSQIYAITDLRDKEFAIPSSQIRTRLVEKHMKSM